MTSPPLPSTGTTSDNVSSAPPPIKPGIRSVAVPLAVMSAVQAMVSIGAISLAIVAIPASKEIGVDPRLLGSFTAILFLTAVVAAAIGGGLVGRLGGIRVNQFCLIFSLIGLGLVVSAWLPLVVLAAVCFGLSLGPSTPASTHILARRTPPNLLGLVLSIKQTGGSFGHFIAGITLPPLILIVGWRGGIAIVALVTIVLVVALQPLRRVYDDDVGYSGSKAERIANLLAGLKLVATKPDLRLLTLCAFAFCATQVALTYYFVVFLSEQAHFGLIAAGRGLSVATIAGVMARMMLAYVTDRGYIKPRLMLGLLGLSMLLSCLGLYAITPEWPVFTVYLLSLFVGASTMTWSGILLADMVRQTPSHLIAQTTGGAFSVMFAGAVAGPALFAFLLSLTGDYTAGLILLGVVPALLALWLVLPARRPTG